MQSTSPPSLIPTPFALSGARNTVPETGSSTGSAASFQYGFPAATMQPASSGGIPPAGQDFNGVLYQITSILQWLSGGGMFTYSSTFAADSNVGGYPKGAMLAKAATTGYWVNTVDNNTTNPDTGGAGWVDLAAVLGVGSTGGGGLGGSASVASGVSIGGGSSVELASFTMPQAGYISLAGTVSAVPANGLTSASFGGMTVQVKQNGTPVAHGECPIYIPSGNSIVLCANAVNQYLQVAKGDVIALYATITLQGDSSTAWNTNADSGSTQENALTYNFVS